MFQIVRDRNPIFTLICQICYNSNFAMNHSFLVRLLGTFKFRIFCRYFGFCLSKLQCSILNNYVGTNLLWMLRRSLSQKVQLLTLQFRPLFPLWKSDLHLGTKYAQPYTITKLSLYKHVFLKGIQPFSKKKSYCFLL